MIAGDAEISVGTWKNGQTKKIRDVYRHWKIGVPDSLGRTRLLPSTRNLATRTLNLETGVMEGARMVDVRECGVNPVVRIELATGHVLRCVSAQQIWSPAGWVKAGDVAPNDLLGRQGKIAVGARVGIPKRLREGIQFWTTEMKSELIQAVDICHVCGGVFPKCQLELDHVVPVSQDLARALDAGNLAPICEPCHSVKSGQESWADTVRRRAQANGARFERVLSIRADGEESTFDIEMPPPWRNVVAGGLIVQIGSHNAIMTAESA